MKTRHLNPRTSLFLPILEAPASSKVYSPTASPKAPHFFFKDPILKGILCSHFILMMKLINRPGAWVRFQPRGLTLRLKLGQNFRFWETGLGLHPPLPILRPHSPLPLGLVNNCLPCFPSPHADEGNSQAFLRIASKTGNEQVQAFCGLC